MAQLTVIGQPGTESGTSIFDPHHAPSQELMDQCVHCGFCLPTCPTYALWNEEMDSPRGRIYLMNMASQGAIAGMDERFVSHFDRCLGCMSCMSACPSGVQYGELITATRAQIERHYRRSMAERAFRHLIFSVFPYPARMRIALLPAWLYQVSGLRWLARKTGLLRFLPTRVRTMESLLPEITWSSLFGATTSGLPAVGARRMRVGLLLGCVQRVLFGKVNDATARVLSTLGCEVVVPPAQGCCGALMAHAGREPDALQSARSLIEVFDRANVDAIVVNAAGCGSNIKDYPHLLADDPEYCERARVMAAKCRDVSELITELGGDVSFGPVPLRVAYHDSCHLRHAQGIVREPREILRAIPGLELIELPEPDLCCGSAGIYNLVQPAAAEQLARRKAQHIIQSGAEALISANPGCMLQIGNALRRSGHEIPLLHVIEVVDRSMRPAATQDLAKAA